MRLSLSKKLYGIAFTLLALIVVIAIFSSVVLNKIHDKITQINLASDRTDAIQAIMGLSLNNEIAVKTILLKEDEPSIRQYLESLDSIDRQFETNILLFEENTAANPSHPLWSSSKKIRELWASYSDVAKRVGATGSLKTNLEALAIANSLETFWEQILADVAEYTRQLRSALDEELAEDMELNITRISLIRTMFNRIVFETKPKEIERLAMVVMGRIKETDDSLTSIIASLPSQRSERLVALFDRLRIEAIGSWGENTPPGGGPLQCCRHRTV